MYAGNGIARVRAVITMKWFVMEINAARLKQKSIMHSLYRISTNPQLFVFIYQKFIENKLPGVIIMSSQDTRQSIRKRRKLYVKIRCKYSII